MAKLKITTDHRWKPFKYRYDVPQKVLADQFDWMREGEGEDGFIQYRGWWYHLGDFMRTEGAIPDWHGYHGDSAFSGVVIKVSDDGEEYMVGTSTS
jgi:hypothetical protein